jgi:hypothetical protein
VPEKFKSDIAVTAFGTVRTNDTPGFAAPMVGEESVAFVPLNAVKYVPGVIRFTGPITNAPTAAPVAEANVPEDAPKAIVVVVETNPFPIKRVPPNTVIVPDP